MTSDEHGAQMSTVAHLVTSVEVDAAERPGGFAVSLLHEAELVDGRRVVLLDDRGWASSGGWDTTSATEVRRTAREVVGPDEPRDGFSHEQEEAAHWAYLREIARRQGVPVEAAELERAPHEVLLSHRVRSLLDPDPADSG